MALGKKELAGLRVLLKGLVAGLLVPNFGDVGGNLHSLVVSYICVFLCMHLSCVHHWSFGNLGFGAKAFIPFAGGAKNDLASRAPESLSTSTEVGKLRSAVALIP